MSVDWKYLFTTFEGRIGRRDWWTGVVVLFVASVIVSILFGDTGLVSFILSILIFLAGLALHVKRCHDRGKSGWWCLLLLIPVVGFIWALIDLGILQGDDGPNRYGAQPAPT